MSFFFFNDTATTEIYTLSLHDALPIFALIWPTPSGEGEVIPVEGSLWSPPPACRGPTLPLGRTGGDRKSTRLNSSHTVISYAVFCLKKKKVNDRLQPPGCKSSRPGAGA